jgi:hypothetical protein
MEYLLARVSAFISASNVAFLMISIDSVAACFTF